VSGFVKSTMNAVQAIQASLSQEPVPALSVAAGFEEVALRCRKRCAAIHEECQRGNVLFRDLEFQIDFDLASRKRTCLDGLQADEGSLSPGTAKRVKVDLVEETFPNILSFSAGYFRKA